jgi:peptidoglycan/LPS O-acetylase OafA/YrhL
MYLWYRFPLWRIASVVMTHFPKAPALLQYTLIFVIAFTCAAVTASVTYLLIEKPFLELRSRMFHKKERMLYA